MEVVRVGEITKHPDADRLSITRVFGFPVVVTTGDFSEGDLAAYIPADGMVDTNRPEFAFLAKSAKADGRARIKPLKLRGIFSMGLLVPLRPTGDTLAFPDVTEGDDLAWYFGVTKYEPPLEVRTGGMDASPPPAAIPYTDIESFRRYVSVFSPDEFVVVTEKVHGANARFTWQNNELHVGTRTRWLQPGDTIWHKVLAKRPQIVDFCRAFPNRTLFGEVFGRVQDLRYGRDNDIDFIAFDVFDAVNGVWLDYEDFICSVLPHNLEPAPIVYCGPFDLARIKNLVEGDSLVSTKPQLMEGIVIRPLHERWSDKTGRVVLKLHSERYLLRKGVDDEVRAE